MVRALIPGQRTRALTALIACALLLCLAFATPVAAAGPLKLTAGSGDPGSAVAGSAFTFAATYVSKDDEPPAYVRVIVDGKSHEMAPNNASDSDMRDGARYQVRFKIKAPGTYTYSFVGPGFEGSTDDPRRWQRDREAEAEAEADVRPPARPGVQAEASADAGSHVRR